MCEFNLRNNMFSGVKLLMFAVLMTCFQTVFAEDAKVDNLEVVDPLKISLDVEKLEGFIMYDFCGWDKAIKKPKCKMKKLPITPQTKAYENTKEVPLRKAKSRLGKHAEIIFYVDTLTVKSISW